MQTLREIPQSVSVITRQRMDDQNMTTLSDVMRQATGVTMYGNGNGASSFYARQNTLEAQYDGVPGFSSLSQSQFDMALYDRVEILRGPAGLLQGSGNPSGVVNLVRKRPQVQFEGAGSVSIGSWNQRRVELDAGEPVNEGGSVRLRGVLTGEDRDFFYDHAGRRNWTAYGAAEVDFSHRFDDRWTLKASLRHRRNETDQLWGNPRGTVSRATGLGGVEVVNGNYIYENTGADVHLSGSFDAFGRRHEVLVGYNHDAYQSTSAGSYYEATGVDLRDPSIYDMSLLPPIASTTANKTTQSGLYAMGRLKLADPLTLIVGGRLTDYQNEARNVAPVATAWDGQGRARARNEFTPHLGVVYDVSPTLTAYGSYSDIFIPQTAIDYHGKVLEPRVGWQTEVGLKGEFFDKRLQASMAAFRIRDRNRAMTDPDPTHVGPPCGTSATSSCSIAAGLVQIQGWEIELIGRVSTKVDIALGYSRVTGKYLKDSTLANVGQPFSTWQPTHLLKLWGTVRLNERWSLGAGLNAQNAIYSKGYPAWGIAGVRQPGYVVAGAQVGWHINRSLSATLTVNNLFDKTYYDQINDSRSYNYYGEPRSVKATLSYKY